MFKIKFQFISFIFLLFFLIDTKITYKEIERIDINASRKDYPQSPPIYINVLVVSFKNRTRIDTNYRSWGRFIKYTNVNSIYKISSVFMFPPYRSIIISYAINEKRSDNAPFGYLLIEGFEKGLRDFLKNTNLPWYLRTTDDVFVYYPNLAKLLYKLEEKYDPYNDYVLKGNYVNPPGYMHGGSGWLLSRKAAQKIYYEMQKQFIVNKDRSDDVVVATYLNTLSIPKKQWNSKAFVGTALNKESENRFLSYNFDDLPKCHGWNQFRVVDVAVWHAQSAILYPLLFGNEYMKILPKNVYLCTKGNNLNLCANCTLSEPSYIDDL